MQNLEMDLQKIAELGEKKYDENHNFRIFLKNRSGNKVDKMVHRLHEEISSEIDCTKCGNCCKILRPCVTKVEIKRLSGIKIHR